MAVGCRSSSCFHHLRDPDVDGWGQVVTRHARKSGAGIDWLIRKLEEKPPARVSGTAVFLTPAPDAVPIALLHNLKHNRATS